MQADAIDAVNDEPADDADADGKERHHDADGNVPEDDCRARLPHKVQHRRDVLERAQAVAPGAERWRRARLDPGPGPGTDSVFRCIAPLGCWLGARAHCLIELPAARLQRAASLNGGETVYAMRNQGVVNAHLKASVYLQLVIVAMQGAPGLLFR